MKTYREFITEGVNADIVHKVIHHPDNHDATTYKDKNGNKFVGVAVNSLPSAMREAGHKAGRDYKDSYELKRAGLNIRSGEYDQGVKPTGKSVEVVHMYDHGDYKGLT